MSIGSSLQQGQTLFKGNIFSRQSKSSFEQSKKDHHRASASHSTVEAGLLQSRQDQDADKQVALNKGTDKLHVLRESICLLISFSLPAPKVLGWWEL